MLLAAAAIVYFALPSAGNPGYVIVLGIFLVIVVDAARSRVVADWHIAESGRGAERRLVEVRGEVAPGSRLSVDAEPFAVYDLPAPFPLDVRPRWIHGARRATVRDVLDDGAVIEEIAVDGVTWDTLPLALTPSAPPRAGNQQKAIDAWADALLAAAYVHAASGCR